MAKGATDLHEDEGVESQGPQVCRIPLGVEDGEVAIMESEDDCQLIDGLKENHLPHGDRNNR
jgi:hypothetical protein